MPRVLMFAHWFPPCQRWPTAARRAEGFARHLPAVGWDALVVAPDLGYGLCACGAEHDGAVDEIDTRRLRLPPGIGTRLDGLLHGTEETVRNVQYDATPSLAGTARSLFESRGQWIRTALTAAGELAASGNFDAIWTTSSPQSTILVGHRLQRSLKLPWVADLRDPVADAIVPPGAHPGGQRLLRTVLYQPALRRASAVVAASRAGAELDEAELGRPVDWIYSGIEEAWLQEAADAPHPTPGSPATRLHVTGAIYPSTMDLTPLLNGISRARRAGTEVELHYAGRHGDVLRRAASRAGVESAVRDSGWLDQHEVRRRLATSDLNVLLGHAHSSHRIPGKVFEYLACSRPILALPGDEELATLLRDTGAGTTASSAEEVARAIANPRKLATATAPGRLAPWSVAAMAGRLGGVLDRCVAAGPGRHSSAA